MEFVHVFDPASRRYISSLRADLAEGRTDVSTAELPTGLADNQFLELMPDGSRWRVGTILRTDGSGEELTLERAKKEKRSEIVGARNAAEVAPIVVAGAAFDVDITSLMRIKIALDMAKVIPGWSEEWTLADNTSKTVTADTLQAVILALAMRSRELHMRSRLLQAQVEGATTIEAVQAIVW